MPQTISLKKLASMIDSDRIAVCEMLKTLELDNNEILSKILEMPHPKISKGREKKVKSDEPKKVSGYIVFSNDFRSKQEGLTSKEIIRAASEVWKTLNDESKKVWTEKANISFAEAVKAYKETHPHYEPENKSKKEKKNNNIPSSKSAYSLFVSAFSKTCELKGKGKLTEAAKVWKEMDDESKEPYVKESDAHKNEARKFKRFFSEMKDELLESGIEDDKKKLYKAAAAKWIHLSEEDKAKYTSESESEDSDSSIKKTKKKSVKVPSKKSAYNFFVIDIKSEVPTGEKLMEFASQKWKEMDDEEKAPFEEKAGVSKMEFEKFKNFMEENTPAIKEKLGDELENENDKKKQKKMISEAAAKMWNN